MATQSTESKLPRPGTIVVTVLNRATRAELRDAMVVLYNATGVKDQAQFNAASWAPSLEQYVASERTNRRGMATFNRLSEGCYVVAYGHVPKTKPECVCVRAGCIEDV